MLGHGWRIGRIAGIELRVDASWLMIVLLVGYSLVLRFEVLYRGLAPGEAFVLGVATTALFFASVLLHELAHALVARRRGLPVKEDVMAPDLRSIPGDASVQEAVDGYFMRYDHGAFPVADDGNIVGLLTLRGVRRIPRQEWGGRTVRESMTALDESVSVAPRTPVRTVVEKLERPDVQRVVVMKDDRVAGMITANDLAAWLRRRQRLE